MPGRTFTSTIGYKYGFGGQMKDDEVSGNGNSYTAEYWQYDSRLGRRWNRDPIIKDWESPYATFSNNSILFIDPSGLDAVTKLSAGTRFKNWVKGDGYLNKANQYAVDNKIDDSQMHFGTGKVGSVTIDESFYTRCELPSTTGQLNGEFYITKKEVTFTDGNTFGANTPLRLWGFQIANVEGSSWADNSPVESAGAYADVSYKFKRLKYKTEVKYIGTSDENETLTVKTSTTVLNKAAILPELSAGTGLVFKFGPTRSEFLTADIGGSVGFINATYNVSTREFKIGVKLSTTPIKLNFAAKIEAGVKAPDVKLFEAKD
jgi:RHS repeat-associated protein